MAHGKKYRKVIGNVDRTKPYKLDEAVKLVKQNATATQRKFDETIEIAMNLGIDTKHVGSDRARRRASAAWQR